MYMYMYIYNIEREREKNILLFCKDFFMVFMENISGNTTDQNV